MTMSRYYNGYSEARANVERMPLPELLRYIDGLWGRDGLRYGDDVDTVRVEALRQCEREFTNPEWEKEWGPTVRAAAKYGRTWSYEHFRELADG